MPTKKANQFRNRLDERRQALKEAETPTKPSKETIGDCSCGGSIVLSRTYTSEYQPIMGPPIIGPGSRSQFRKVERKECYCESCGVLYNPEIVIGRQG